jgi:hypothetical protein
MRARDRDAPAGAGGEHGVEAGLVGIGGAARDAAQAEREKAARMLNRFAELPEGTFVWTRGERFYFLGRIAGPCRYDDSPAAHEVGIHHVRAAVWVERPFGEHEVPAAVAATFARGGRNFQRIHGEAVERETSELWRRHHTA